MHVEPRGAKVDGHCNHGERDDEHRDPEMEDGDLQGEQRHNSLMCVHFPQMKTISRTSQGAIYEITELVTYFLSEAITPKQPRACDEAHAAHKKKETARINLSLIECKSGIATFNRGWRCVGFYERTATYRPVRDWTRGFIPLLMLPYNSIQTRRVWRGQTLLTS